jgi:MFS family permease
VSTAGNELVALAGFAISGAGVALVAPALFARAGRMAQPGRRGAAIATLTVFGYTGFLVGPVIVGLLSEAAGLRVAIACLGVLAIVLAIGGQLVLGGRRTAGFEEGEALLRTSRG